VDRHRRRFRPRGALPATAWRRWNAPPKPSSESDDERLLGEAVDDGEQIPRPVLQLGDQG
jgi:hypothetical protein